jgi:hypothetical protein
MELKDGLFLILPGMVQLIAWAVPAVFGVIMVKHGGLKPERLFLTGSLVMVFDQLVAIIRTVHTNIIILSGVGLGTPENISAVNNTYFIINSLLFLAGMVLLVFAFWLKFKKHLESA